METDKRETEKVEERQWYGTAMWKEWTTIAGARNIRMSTTLIKEQRKTTPEDIERSNLEDVCNGKVEKIREGKARDGHQNSISLHSVHF